MMRMSGKQAGRKEGKRSNQRSQLEVEASKKKGGRRKENQEKVLNITTPRFSR
jgi:hypothetical protein